MTKLDISFFSIENDHNGLSIEGRIEAALDLLQNEDDYLQFEDGTTCSNEEELKKYLKEKNIL